MLKKTEIRELGMEFIKSFRAVERNYHLIKMRICDLILNSTLELVRYLQYNFDMVFNLNAYLYKNIKWTVR